MDKLKKRVVKLAIFMLVVFFVSIMATGCLSFGGDDAETEETEKKELTAGDIEEIDDGRYFVSLWVTNSTQVVCNTKTRVMYEASRGTSNFGNFTTLVDRDGKPQIFEGDISDLPILSDNYWNQKYKLGPFSE